MRKVKGNGNDNASVGGISDANSESLFSCIWLTRIVFFVIFVVVALPVLMDFLTTRELVGIQDSRVTCTRFKTLCDPNVPYQAPETIMGEKFSEGWNYGHEVGRWVSPLKQINFLSDMYTIGTFWQFITLKKWLYMSITNEKYFIGFAFVDLQYAGDVFLYIVDKENPSEKFEYHALAPLAIGLKFSSSSIDGCTGWNNGDIDMSTCFDSKADRWVIKMNTVVTSNLDPNKSKRLVIDATADLEEGLIFSYPVNGNQWRPAYVHKGAGMNAEGTIQFDDEDEYSFEDGIAAIDWTKAHAKRTTIWRWASLSARDVLVAFKNTTNSEISSSKKRIGINLSTDVYDIQNAKYTPNKPSVENAIWIDGVMIPLQSPVKFVLPKNPKEEKWSIVSTDPSPIEKIELTFKPLGVREAHDDFTVVVSDFVQPYGVFSGMIRVTDRNGNRHHIMFNGNEVGVVEDHYAVW